MATEFRDSHGTPVARLSWGGEFEGRRLSLLSGAGSSSVDFDTPLTSDAGRTKETLRTLALLVGDGRRCDACCRSLPENRHACGFCGGKEKFFTAPRRED